MFPTLEVISVSCAIHRINNGFISKQAVQLDKKHEGKKANSDLLYSYFFSENKIAILQEDRDLAVEVIDYLKGLSFKAIERELTDFESNVLKLVNTVEIGKDKIGMASSLPRVYINKIDQDNWTSRETQLSTTSQAIGELNSRSSFDATVEYVRYIPKTMSYLISCSVDNKHILKFFADKLIKPGTNINIGGHVKSQNRGRYHNGIETIINRTNISEVINN